MEPDVIRMYSSSPPPMEDGAEDEDDDFGDFGAFSGVPNSISFSEFETPTTFDQNQALTATSPPELLSSRGVVVNGVTATSHCGDAPERTDWKKGISCSPELSASEPVSCNGGSMEVLTNGFVTCDIQGSPPSQNSVHTFTQDRGGGADQDEFSDFAAFSSEGRACSRQAEPSSEDDIRDTNRTGTDRPESDSCCPPPEDPHAHTHSQQRDVASPLQHSPTEAVCTNPSPTLNGGGDNDLSTDTAGDSEKGSETETETSLGRPLSTDALEEYGDMSTTGSAPSPPPQGGAATPTDQDEDFGDFGDAGSFAGQGFADFEQLEIQQDSKTIVTEVTEQDDDFGDFNSPKIHPSGSERGEFTTFPASDSFGNFSSADAGGADGGWSAFGEQQQEEGKGESWAEFSTEPSVAPASESRGGEEEEVEEWHEGGTTAVVEETSQADRQQASLSFRLEKLFHSSFPPVAVQLLDEEVETLKVQLEPDQDKNKDQDEDRGIPGNRSVSVAVWMRLQDIHEALGLRYQWGGSYCNKALLCCLGIDTRNILFTGQKKQPVIVPMYAAGLGMLEPTKEPVKPVSAAEMIASIAAPERSSCPTDAVQQEALPPIQFDWSSSGLTNPLDASGGSSLLNLDFFGPVEDSGSTSSPSIPGVDPELFELTTAKLDPSGSGSRVADAFARLMSTMEKTSTSTRKPKKDENLSDEAAKVISALPDLSFMQAKVLMFPATLTPLGSQATPD